MAVRRPVDVLGVPTPLGLRPPAPGRIPGTRHAPAALRRAGLAQALDAYDHGDLPEPPYDPEGDAATGFLNGDVLPGYSRAIADRVGPLLSPGRRLLVLGGDCSLMLGTALALRRRGRCGLVFLDGHSDWYLPRHGGPRTAAGTDLGLVLGDGPDPLTDLDGARPYLQAQDVVAFGYRDGEDDAHATREAFRASPMQHVPIAAIRATGALACMRTALRTLASKPLDGLWIHLDVDVLDPRWMPAVDSPEPPGGLDRDELQQVLALLLAHPATLGLQVTVFDPERDPGGEHAARLVDLLAAAFGRR